MEKTVAPFHVHDKNCLFVLKNKTGRFVCLPIYNFRRNAVLSGLKFLSPAQFVKVQISVHLCGACPKCLTMALNNRGGLKMAAALGGSLLIGVFAD